MASLTKSGWLSLQKSFTVASSQGRQSEEASKEDEDGADETGKLSLCLGSLVKGVL